MGVSRLPEVREYRSRDEKFYNTFITSRIGLRKYLDTYTSLTT